MPTVDGDWIFIENPNEITHDYLGLRFESDTLYTIHGGGLTLEGQFTIDGDIIVVREFGDKINKLRRIKKLTNDSLIVAGSAFDEKYYSRKLEFTDSLRLNELTILAGDCFGDCPQFSLKLNDNGLIQFKPILDCKVTNETDFTLDSKKKNKIDSLFKWTYLQKLDTSKVYSALDDWDIGMEIKYNNGQKIEFRTTRSQIPFRLKWIFGILINSLKENGLI